MGYFAFLETVLGPLMPFLRRELHLSYALASLHFSAFALGAIVMGVAGNGVIRDIGRRAAVWGGVSGMGLGGALLVGSPTAVGTILGAFLMGTLGNLLLIALQASLSDRHQALSRVALTEANVMASLFGILASVAVGFIAGIGLDWRLSLGLPLLLLAALVLPFRRVRFAGLAIRDTSGEARKVQHPRLWHQSAIAARWTAGRPRRAPTAHGRVVWIWRLRVMEGTIAAPYHHHSNARVKYSRL